MILNISADFINVALKLQLCVTFCDVLVVEWVRTNSHLNSCTWMMVNTLWLHSHITHKLNYLLEPLPSCMLLWKALIVVFPVCLVLVSACTSNWASFRFFSGVLVDVWLLFSFEWGTICSASDLNFVGLTCSREAQDAQVNSITANRFRYVWVFCIPLSQPSISLLHPNPMTTTLYCMSNFIYIHWNKVT